MDSIENFVIKDIPSLSPGASLEEAARVLKLSKVHQLSIVDKKDGRPVGVLNENGLMDRCLSLKSDLNKVVVKDCMQKIPLLVRADMGLEHCSMVMNQHHLEQAPVVNSEGQYIGEIRLEDLGLSE